jgi:hypothetical protein
MGIKNLCGSGIVAIVFFVLLSAWLAARPDAQQAPLATVQIDSDDIGGIVTGTNGPEAGVWVIAQTTELGTRFAKMVVTDDQGR